MSKPFLNKASQLLLPGIKTYESAMVRLGLIGCFIGDEDYDKEVDRSLFLLFENKDEGLLGKLISHLKDEILDDYDVGEFTILVVRWPKQWNHEWDLYLEGKYSHFRDSYKDNMTVMASPLEEKFVGKMSSPGYLIVTKHPGLKNWQEERLGVTLEDWQEVSSIIDMNEEVFQYDRFKLKYDEHIRCEQDKKTMA